MSLQGFKNNLKAITMKKERKNRAEIRENCDIFLRENSALFISERAYENSLGSLRKSHRSGKLGEEGLGWSKLM